MTQHACSDYKFSLQKVYNKWVFFSTFRLALLSMTTNNNIPILILQATTGLTTLVELFQKMLLKFMGTPHILLDKCTPMVKSYLQ